MSIFCFKNYIFNKKILFLYIFFFLFLNFTAIAAEDISSLQTEINARNEEIKKLQIEIDTYSNKVAGTKAEGDTLKAAISKLESQKKDLLSQIRVNTLKIKNTENSISNTLENINSNHDTIDRNRKALAKTLREIKINEDSDSFVLNLLKTNGRGFGEMLNDSFRFYNLNDSISDNIENISNTIIILNQNKNSYEKQKNELTDLSKELSSKEDIVLQNQKEKNTLLKDTKNQENAYQQILADRKKKVANLQDEINTFESKIKYILDKSKLPTNNKGLSWPVKKVLITQYFGDTEFSRTGAYNGNGHNGIDFGLSVGNAILAASDGVVMGVGDTDAYCAKASYGKWILIKHNNGLATLYGHLSSINVYSGQSVELGQQIGLSGNTGYSTGPHLHFTVIASDAVRIFGPTEYKSRTCGTYMVMPYAPINAYLNPMTYLPK